MRIRFQSYLLMSVFPQKTKLTRTCHAKQWPTPPSMGELSGVIMWPIKMGEVMGAILVG